MKNKMYVLSAVIFFNITGCASIPPNSVPVNAAIITVLPKVTLEVKKIPVKKDMPGERMFKAINIPGLEGIKD